MEQRDLEEFTEELAAKTSTPGGGGAAALTGALAAALAAMAANFTEGKKKYIEYEDDMLRIIKRTNEIRLLLLDNIDEDAKAFLPLSKAYAIKAVTDTEIENKRKKLEKALISATVPPMEIIKLISELSDIFKELSVKGTRLLLSDVGAGAVLARSAAEAALLAVYANTKMMTDTNTAKELEGRAEGEIDRIAKVTEEAYNSVIESF